MLLLSLDEKKRRGRSAEEGDGKKREDAGHMEKMERWKESLVKHTLTRMMKSDSSEEENKEENKKNKNRK